MFPDAETHTALTLNGHAGAHASFLTLQVRVDKLKSAEVDARNWQKRQLEELSAMNKDLSDEEYATLRADVIAMTPVPDDLIERARQRLAECAKELGRSKALANAEVEEKQRAAEQASQRLEDALSALLKEDRELEDAERRLREAQRAAKPQATRADLRSSVRTAAAGVAKATGVASTLGLDQAGLDRAAQKQVDLEKDNVEKGKQKVAELTSDEIERRVSELNEAISEAEGLVLVAACVCACKFSGGGAISMLV